MRVHVLTILSHTPTIITKLVVYPIQKSLDLSLPEEKPWLIDNVSLNQLQVSHDFIYQVS